MNKGSSPRRPLGHPIGVVATRTGLTPELIRAWERRYQAITPERSPASGRRYYSDADIERLALLRSATLAGRRIGDVVGLSREELAELMQADRPMPEEARREPGRAQSTTLATEHLNTCLTAAGDMDARALEAALAKAAATLGTLALLDEVVAPLLRRIGDHYEQGTLRVAQEHASTAVVRSFLAHSLDAGAMNNGPPLVVATLSDHYHELGALMAAVVASLDDWRVTYLGPNLPASEIAYAAMRMHARAVALSLIYPTDDPRVATELRMLRQQLPQVALFVGGRAAPFYRTELNRVAAIQPEELSMFRQELAKLVMMRTR